MENLKIWNAFKRPPAEALKKITGGRISGMTDINPQWRLKAMTEQFGVIGIGWKYAIRERWTETLDGQVACFIRIELMIKDGESWSAPIEGIGGSMLLEKEKAGLHVSDEGYKMALTDALSVAMKQLGVAADIYAGLWDGAKYKDTPTNTEITEITAEELQAIDDIYNKILDTAGEQGLAPDKDNIRSYYYNKKKLYPKTKEDVTAFVKHILSGKNLIQICKPIPK
jgi:hypothetical protein